MACTKRLRIRKDWVKADLVKARLIQTRMSVECLLSDLTRIASVDLGRVPDKAIIAAQKHLNAAQKQITDSCLYLGQRQRA
jgi:hypothetical protein